MLRPAFSVLFFLDAALESVVLGVMTALLTVFAISGVPAELTDDGVFL